MRRRAKNKNAPVPETCRRCYESFGEGPRCAYCGVHKGRVVKPMTGSAPKALA